MAHERVQSSNAAPLVLLERFYDHSVSFPLAAYSLTVFEGMDETSSSGGGAELHDAERGWSGSEVGVLKQK